MGVSAVYRIYQCCDGWIFIAARTEGQAKAVVDVASATVDDGPPLAAARDGALAETLEAYFIRTKRDDALQRLAQFSVPASPCLLLEEVFDDRHLRANDMWWQSRHGLLGRFQQIGALLKWGEHAMRLERPAPLFAEHSQQVLEDFGIEQDRVKQLVEKRVVLTAEGPAPTIQPYETA
jgi:crotonobetainyl-CoA:carnitine CoA-transferase CaiB-like acyl-CoA transferase